VLGATGAPVREVAQLATNGTDTRFGWSAGNLTRPFGLKTETLRREKNEHLDDTICCSADCLDWRLHYVSRSGRADSFVVGIRGDFPDPAFCDGKTDRLRVQVPYRVHFRDEHGGLCDCDNTCDKVGESGLDLIALKSGSVRE
jgi:hypothetical protein